MSELKKNNDDVKDSRDPATEVLFEILIVLGIMAGGLFLSYLIISSMAPEKERAIADIKAEQVAEGSHYTAVVTAVDMSNGKVTLDNDHVIPTGLLEATPNVGDVLTYTKTFEYEVHERTGMPYKTERDTFLDVQSIGHVSK